MKMTRDRDDREPSHSHSSRRLMASVQKLVQLESQLTSTMESTRPLLDLPTPNTLSQVQEVLALARSYSSKTSAPPGWSPSLPVLHFSTPNPLPHQLRRGNLSMMELEMIRQEKKAQILQKRKLAQQHEVEAQKLKLNQHKQLQKEARDPKKKELQVHYDMEDESERNVIHDIRKGKQFATKGDSLREVHVRNEPSEEQTEKKMSATTIQGQDKIVSTETKRQTITTMNLSDSESEDEEESTSSSSSRSSST